jgi:hypothetical protein
MMKDSAASIDDCRLKIAIVPSLRDSESTASFPRAVALGYQRSPLSGLIVASNILIAESESET